MDRAPSWRLRGLPLADAFEIAETKTGRETRALHSFYRLGDGSFLAFFEVIGADCGALGADRLTFQAIVADLDPTVPPANER